MPGGGLEPPTRGFSSAALPTELPGQITHPRGMEFREARDPSSMDITAHKETVQPEFTEKSHTSSPLPSATMLC